MRRFDSICPFCIFFPYPLEKELYFLQLFFALIANSGEFFRTYCCSVFAFYALLYRHSKHKGGFIQLIEIIMTILAICLLVKAISLAFKITWNVAKIVATIMMILAVPVFIVCLIFAGGFILLIPVALIAGSIGILAKCA